MAIRCGKPAIPCRKPAIRRGDDVGIGRVRLYPRAASLRTGASSARFRAGASAGGEFPEGGADLARQPGDFYPAADQRDIQIEGERLAWPDEDQ